MARSRLILFLGFCLFCCCARAVNPELHNNATLSGTTTIAAGGTLDASGSGDSIKLPGGITVNAVTGTGSFVLSTSPTVATPTLSGTTTVQAGGSIDLSGSGDSIKLPGGITVNAVTGTGSFVLSTSATLVTPVLGVATATSINGLSISTATNTLTLTSGTTSIVANASGTLGSNAFTSTAYVPTSRTVNGHALSGNVTVAASDISPTFTAGTNVTLSGSWPNITINASGGSSFSGTYGASNIASGLHAVAMGDFSQALNDDAIAVGYNTNASGSESAAFGSNTSSGAVGSFSTGLYSVASLGGQFATAAGLFAVPGDAQFTRVVLAITTADATPTNLTILATGGEITLTSGKTYAFTARVSAREQGTTSQDALFVLYGIIDNGSGTPSIVGAVSQVETIDTIVTGGVVISADTVDNALQIQVTGVASTNIAWVAVVECVEISY